MANTPWDARLAARIVRPLCHSWVTPNHLTTLRLLTGLGAALIFGGGKWPNLAAWLWVLSTFLDHTDGELARISGKKSALGHRYDLLTDALVTIGLFIGIGWGLANSPLGAWAQVMGLITGSAITLIFYLRNKIENHLGKAATQQPTFAGFEPEDTLYLLPLVVWVNGLVGFLSVATLATLLVAAFVTRQYYYLRHKLYGANKMHS